MKRRKAHGTGTQATVHGFDVPHLVGQFPVGQPPKRLRFRKNGMTMTRPTAAKPAQDRSADPQETAPRDGRRLRGEDSAQRIIEATIDVIAENGLSGVTMQRIAARVGSSNALVVFHFGTKENLFRAVLQYLSDQYDDLWTKMVRLPDIPPEQRLLRAMDCARHFTRQHPRWVSVWVAFSGDRKTIQLDRMISLPNDRGYVTEARALIDAIARAGGYVDVDADTLSAGLNYLVQGAWFWDSVNPDEAGKDTLHKTALMLLRHVFPRHFPVDRDEGAFDAGNMGTRTE
jgi:AcrR family transcriptional regulator